MRTICCNLAVASWAILGSALDGTDPRIIFGLTVFTVVLTAAVLLGGEE